MAVPEGGLPLTPFIHQVGGHRAILLYDKRTICKPAFERELQNYCSLAPIMGDFMPKFKGVVEVVIEKDEEGKVTYKAITAPSISDHLVLHDEALSNIELELISSVESKSTMNHAVDEGGDVCINHENHVSCSEGQSFHINQNTSPCQRITPNHQCLDDRTGPTTEKVFEDATEYCFRPRGNGLNPWSLRVHHEEALRLTTGENRPFKIHTNYMLLENVTVDYQCPSIIDLKIGTRTYGDDLSEEKKQLNIARALGSTTNKLGVRFGGMQIYQADKGTYVCCNKKYGNKLTEDDLRYEVGRFVYAKHRHSRRIRASIIRRITQLRDLISRMDQHRFFACSVLIIYEGMDGAVRGASSGRGSDVSSASDGDSPSSNRGVLEGKSGVDCEDEDEGLGTEDGHERAEDDDDDDNGDIDDDVDDSDEDDKVLVKIIDFAHSSSVEVQGMDGVRYEGIDQGFVYGLETLIELMKEEPAKT